MQDLALNDPNIFQVDDCDAFDFDVDDEPIAQTIFMANLSSAVSSPQQSGPSNLSVISGYLNCMIYAKGLMNRRFPTKYNRKTLISQMMLNRNTTM